MRHVSLVDLIGSGKFIGSVYDWVKHPSGEVVRSHPRIHSDGSGRGRTLENHQDFSRHCTYLGPWAIVSGLLMQGPSLRHPGGSDSTFGSLTETQCSGWEPRVVAWKRVLWWSNDRRSNEKICSCELGGGMRLQTCFGSKCDYRFISLVWRDMGP
jgi:hypothetical protein